MVNPVSSAVYMRRRIREIERRLSSERVRHADLEDEMKWLKLRLADLENGRRRTEGED